ncbi:cysteine protease StiP family protein [Microbulbifer guangxiensis]|uniref:cysteine protease StiP family protein n=1 Tax=Microbulbifer guangxiensis TaxID=2904249 RepID=UPI001F218E0D|nr:cysteine protease StiP family protein [Microbulbifer guangxiensis]
MSTSNKKPILGSYPAEDCLFLLKPIKTEYHTVEDKETLIQRGKLHYSEIIHKENIPSSEYTSLFFELTQQYKQRLADEVTLLASIIDQRVSDAVCLVSLARAGTPIGVLLKRALMHHYKKKSTHYSISIVRDRGIDENALDFILKQGHKTNSIVFIDGWTAKGVIASELRKSIKNYNESRGTCVPSELFVISDIGGCADFSAGSTDYTIPSALMNSTISGLVSRSILNEQIRDDDFHGCVRYDHLRKADLSLWFVDEISDCFRPIKYNAQSFVSNRERRRMTQSFLNALKSRYQVSDENRIKPGIAEATRVLLRRIPDLLLVKNRLSGDIKHLIRLCDEKKIPYLEMPEMPFGACALIKDVVVEAAGK